MASQRRLNIRGRRRGVLTFEWILLISLLVIGVIAGMSAVRNALLCELHDLARCVHALSVRHCHGWWGHGHGHHDHDFSSFGEGDSFADDSGDELGGGLSAPDIQLP